MTKQDSSREHVDLVGDDMQNLVEQSKVVCGCGEKATRALTSYYGLGQL